MPPRHVYVHVPFCARRCSYCDFAIAVRQHVPTDEYLEGIRREIERRYPEGGDPVETIYLGGGTPSRLGAGGVTRLLGIVRGRWTPVSGAEVTLEANPEDVDAARVTEWVAAGVTRVSLGAQSFHEASLRWMHRSHDGRGVETAVATLTAAGITNWSLDLIFALPGDLRRDWSRDLDRALALAPTHLSAYGLTLEPHTPFAHWTARGAAREADESTFEDEFLAAHQTLESAGLVHYEVSNYARPGAESRHNSAYWRRADYVGLGPSAHSFERNTRRWNEREYLAWQKRVLAGEDPVAGTEELSSEAIALEELYLGLRTKTGVQSVAADRPLLERWSDAGWAHEENGRLVLTPTGWMRIDALAAALTEFRSRL